MPTFVAPADPLYAFLHALPKVELHCHLLGTVRRDTFTSFVRRADAAISDAEIEAFYTRGEKPVGVLRVLRALDAELIRSPDDLHRLTYEYLQDAAAHQVRYAEFFWNPTGTAQQSGLAYPQALGGIVRAIADAQTDFGITGRLIAAIDREAPPEAATEMVEWVLAHRREEVIGIGIDYREVDHPPEWFAPAYALARRGGLKTTAHAGEFGMPWNNVRTAIDVLQVDRIDHGYTVLDNPALVRECADRGIVFTVVPTNSYYLRTLAPERWSLDHPIRHMPAAGLRIHPNTDDPTLHQVNPTQAWAMMVRDFGFGAANLRSFLVNGLDAAWIDDGTRRAWQAQWLAAFLMSSRLSPPSALSSSQSAVPSRTRRLAVHLAAALLAGGCGVAVQAQPAWPAAKPITLIVPFSAGGSVDVTARLIAQKLGERLKQSVVIENVAGAGGVSGMEKAAMAAPDGYTFVLGADSPAAIARLVNPVAVRYDTLKDLAPVGLVTTAPMVIVARPGLPANNLADTSPAVVERLNRELGEVLRMDDVRAKLADGGAVAGKGSAAEFARFVQTESARYAAIVKAANIKE
eukprot:gene8047-7876_t